MAVDPDLLVSGVIEEFPCPRCGEQIELELPAPRENRPRTGAACPSCRAPLTRKHASALWEIVPPKPRADAACVFCGAKADSYEHVVPAWVSKRLGIKTFLSAEDAFVSNEALRPKQPISFANYRARVFCHGCNRHFKHLEDAVIPLLVPMAKGRALSLNRESQQLLAVWAQKTAIALVTAASDPPYPVPARHRSAVRSDGKPSDDCRVAFFSWQGGPLLGTAQAEVGHRRQLAAAVEGYVAFLAFARIGFRVVGFEQTVPAPLAAARGPEWLIQFHPAQDHLVTWPPKSVDNRILPALLQWPG